MLAITLANQDAFFTDNSLTNILDFSFLNQFNFIGTANAQSMGSNPIAGFLPFILILGVMYFLVIRPQNKKAKEHREMVTALKKGDRIVGAGGLFGTVSKIIDEHEIEVEITNGVFVSMVRSSVTNVISRPTLAKKAADSSETVTKTLKKTAAQKSTKKKSPEKKSDKKAADKATDEDK